ncbi:MAG: hypothetical protein C0453_08125 [Comamonadaceae bacterium]|nr:hypothetical protein [Comamonadaceae bacterium]
MSPLFTPRWLPVLAVLLATGASAQPTPSAEIERLAVKAASSQGVRLIIGLNETVEPETRLSKSAAGLQRARVRAAQDSAISKLLSGTGSQVRAQFERQPHFVADVDANAMARLRSSKLVRSLEEDVPLPSTLLESTSLVQAPDVWASGRTGTGWTVAVLDTGVDKNHPFLTGKVVSEACYSSNTSIAQSVCPGGVTESTAAGSGMHCSSASDACRHGTHVAGIVAGSGGPNGTQGVAPGAKLISVQVFSHFPSYGTVMAYTSDIIRGLERVYALRETHQIAAVNMSLGGGQYTSSCDNVNGATKFAIDNLRAAGVATVIASGNDAYKNAIASPACISSAVSVGAHCDVGPDSSACAQGAGGVASYSNIASFVSLLAPGSYIRSSVPGTGYAAFNGTSMAAPHVAGAWAVMKQAQPGISVTEALALFKNHGASVTDTRPGGTVSGLKRVQMGFLAGPARTLTVARSGTGSGLVSSSPSGVNCGGDCTESFPDGGSVTLSAVAATGSTFSGWGGACSGMGSCTVSMTDDRHVIATFTGQPQTLQVIRQGTGLGSVSSSPAGIQCGTTCSVSLPYNTLVTLSATASLGSRFSGWSGACIGTGPCTVTLTSAQQVTATFAVQSHAITVTKSGAGVVTSTTSPLNCGKTCKSTLPHGSFLALAATPSAGSVFIGWSGACTGAGACLVPVNEPTSVHAEFRKSHFRLTYRHLGKGLGTVTASQGTLQCSRDCKSAMVSTEPVTLVAQPAEGSFFAGWGGVCSGFATNSCTVSMDAARTVTATYHRITHALDTVVQGDGKGRITSLPKGVNCASECSRLFNSGTLVTLTANPAKGSLFAGWGGACSGTSTRSCLVPMSQAQSAVAHFMPSHFALQVSKTGTGRGAVVSADSGVNCGKTCARRQPNGSTVTLTATPATGSVFAGWSGACAGSDSCTVFMTQARQVTALFEPAASSL